MSLTEVKSYGNEAMAQRLAQLYLEKTYQFEKPTPETFAKLYKATYEKIYSELSAGRRTE